MIPQANVKEMSFSRASLINALATERMGSHAPQLARAQAMFDCWLQEQEENTQQVDIAKCRSDFEEAMATMMTKAAPAPAPKAKPKPAMKPATQTFVVYFEHDSWALDSLAQVTMRMP